MYYYLIEQLRVQDQLLMIISEETEDLRESHTC